MRIFSSPTARALYFEGVRTAAPFLFATVPFGMVVGVATVSIGLSQSAASLMSLLIFAGTAQLATLPLMVAGAPIAIVIVTAFVINLRFVIYSAAMAPYFKHLSLKWKLLLGYFLTDTGFALSTRRFRQKPEEPLRHWFYLGVGQTICAVWMASTLLGIYVGAFIPKSWSFEFAGALGMLGLLAPFLRTKPEALAAVVAALVGVGLRDMPLKLGLLCAIVAGIASGIGAETLLRRAKPDEVIAPEPTPEVEGEKQAREHNEERIS